MKILRDEFEYLGEYRTNIENINKDQSSWSITFPRMSNHTGEYTYSLVEPRNVSANLPFAGALAGVALRRIQITHYIRPTWPIFSLSPLVPLTFSLSLSLSFLLFFSPFHSTRRCSSGLSSSSLVREIHKEAHEPFLKEPPSADATPFKRGSCVGPVAAAH